MVIPEIDILLHEQQCFVQRVQQEIEEENLIQGATATKRSIRSIVFENGFHGWLERKSSVNGTILAI